MPSVILSLERLALSGLLACSGPGAGRAIASSILFGYVSAAIAFVLLLAAAFLYVVFLGKWHAAVIHLALLALHPAWTVSAIHGDCGFAKTQWSFVAIVVAGILLVRTGKAATSRQREPVTARPPVRFELRDLLGWTTGCAIALSFCSLTAREWWPLIVFLFFFLSATQPLKSLRRALQAEGDRQRELRAWRARIDAAREEELDPSHVTIVSSVSDSLHR